jgi:UTP--glucose-1-phosphate uridylyltransferase
LESALKRAGKTKLLKTLKDTSIGSEAIADWRQNRPMGLGHAIWCARRLVGDEPFAVLLPDDVIAAEKHCLAQLVGAYAETGGDMVATMEVSPRQISSFGVLDVQEDMGDVVRAKGTVEKPKSEDAPSNLAVIGRYILWPKIMTNLHRIKQGTGGEIQLTDAIAEEAASGDVYGYRFRGQRYDCGSKAGYFQATVAFGLSRHDLRDEFSAYMADMIALQKAAQ